MRVEEQYEDVLQNIEFAIVAVYKENPTLSDYAVMCALDALTEQYVAENLGRQPRKIALSGLEPLVFESMKPMCEMRLGRATSGLPNITTYSVDVIVQCLKRLSKSVKNWNKRGGSQGYLHFVSQFVS
jgi:hypothetical protein